MTVFAIITVQVLDNSTVINLNELQEQISLVSSYLPYHDNFVTSGRSKLFNIISFCIHAATVFVITFEKYLSIRRYIVICLYNTKL